MQSSGNGDVKWLGRSTDDDRIERHARHGDEAAGMTQPDGWPSKRNPRFDGLSSSTSRARLIPLNP